jgi:hypothetical protein
MVGIRKIVVFMLLGVTVNLNAQNYSITGNFQDGSVVNENAVLYLNDTCMFYVVSAGEYVDFETVTWKMVVQKKDLGYYSFIDEAENEKRYRMLLNEDHIAKKIDYTLLQSMNRINSETDCSVYFQAKVICAGKTKEHHELFVEFPVFLNLLPSKPTIKIVKTVVDEKPPYLWVEYGSERADEIYYVWKLYDCKWPMASATYPLSIEDKYAKILIEDTEDWEYWGDCYGKELFYFNASNQFGSVLGDSLLSGKDFYTPIENPGYGSDATIHPNPAKDFITIRNLDMWQVESIDLCDVSGRLHKKIFRPQENVLNISDLPKGIYNLVIQFKGIKLITQFKFIKS